MAQLPIISYVEANQQSIECSFYASMGQTAYAAALASAFTGQFYATGGLALVGGAAELAYNLAGCPSDPPPPPSTGEDDRFCWESSTCETIIYRDPPDYNKTVFGSTKALKILSVTKTPFTDTFSRFSIEYIDCNGEQQTLNAPTAGPNGRQYEIDTDNCVGNKPDQPVHTPGEPIAPPQTHTDEDGCNWTIQATDAYVDDAGQWHTYYTITADNDACGGPFAYWSSSSGPDFVPVPPDQPDPPPPPDASKGENCCDELKELLEEIKNCACNSNEQPLEGDYRTISFISDEVSPEGKRRLSKRFRYRSSSGVGLSGVVEHWRSFTWAAGAVCVSHKGSTLGAPQVWAATAEEGKRVIRHAAGEAGVDADQVGRWLVSGSTDPRYGMPGTMRVNTKGGYYWITSRLGPDQRPLVQQS